MSPRCEIGRVPFFFLLHRPEDDALPVEIGQDPFTGETCPMCTECRRFLEAERQAYDEELYRLWCDQYR